MKDDRQILDKLSVKELRRQAALKNVPLQQIAAALEKTDLINLIVRAGPVMDHYDVSTGVKIHSAESIASAPPMVKKKKKKKKRRSSSSSDSQSGSHSTRSRGGRRKKQGKGHRSRSRSRRRKRSKSRRRAKTVSRSPSIQVIVPTVGPHRASGPVMRAVPPPVAATPERSTPSVAAAAAAAAVALPITDVSSPATASTPGAPKKPTDPTLAQAGMAAAAALGFDVLPKAPSTGPAAPAAGLRPSINTVTPAPYGASYMPGGRVCIQYLCTSRCDLGGNCPEAHIIDPEEEMRVRARFKEQECHYGAQCTRAGCLFRHPGEKFEEGNLVPEGQQVTLKVTPHGMALDFM